MQEGEVKGDEASPTTAGLHATDDCLVLFREAGRRIVGVWETHGGRKVVGIRFDRSVLTDALKALQDTKLRTLSSYQIVWRAQYPSSPHSHVGFGVLVEFGVSLIRGLPTTAQRPDAIVFPSTDILFIYLCSCPFTPSSEAQRCRSGRAPTSTSDEMELG